MENTTPTSNGTLNKGTLQESVEKIKSQVSQKTSQTLRSTSDQLDNVKAYIKTHDTEAMVDDLQQVIRTHPGKSVLGGLVLGILLGRLFGIGQNVNR